MMRSRAAGEPLRNEAAEPKRGAPRDPPTILVPSRYRRRLSGPPCALVWYEDVGEAAAAAAGTDAVWLAGFAAADVVSEVLDRGGERLRWVHYSSTGVEHMRLVEFRERGVILTNGAGLYAHPIAEHVIMCMLAARLNLLGLVRAQAAATWAPEAESQQELQGSVALIIGYGALGRAVGVRAQALGVTVLGARRRGDAPCEDGVSSGDTWRAQLPQADFVVLTLPATPETRGILGEQELAAMKAGAWLINVARGSLVDEEALLDALESGHLGGAALDAFQNEPLPPEHPFWTLPNVLLSPHSSWRSSRLDERDVALFSDNLERFIDGGRLRNVVDLDAGY